MSIFTNFNHLEDMKKHIAFRADNLLLEKLNFLIPLAHKEGKIKSFSRQEFFEFIINSMYSAKSKE